MPAMDAVIDPALEAQLETTADARLESYLELLRIPSISALSEHLPDCVRAAEWIAAELRRIGFEHVEVSPTPGRPVVYADWLHAGDAPTILLYCHYDVQPVDPIELWETAPFEPFVKDGRMIGRGSADDKAQLHMHLRAAEAFFATRGTLPLNLRICFEGEEESSSVNLEAWLRANQERLSADAVVISDTSFFEGNQPALTMSLRGLLYAQIDVTLSPVDLHSGSYGGLVENPANALARIISELKDRDGVVQVPGFYDEVVALTPEQRLALQALPFDEAAFAARVGISALAGEKGYGPMEREGARPTLDVNGIWGGFQGEGAKTIIPAHAHAKVSCRLVADQDPHVIFERLRAYVLEVAPAGVSVEVRKLGTGYPTLTSEDQPVAQAALNALRAVFGVEPHRTRNGGSIPVAAMFQTILGLPVVLFGLCNPDSNAHAPNESMVLDNYERGIRAICRLWDDLGRSSAGGATA
jgi:acetylornithine deacetylase/succinyl-diaminopimelate desuccinylase-like protein